MRPDKLKHVGPEHEILVNYEQWYLKVSLIFSRTLSDFCEKVRDDCDSPNIGL